MEEKKIRCTLITPVFSFGAYQYISELRAPELKGAMRYTYRIACPSDTKMLARDEAELFGNASGSAAGHASPYDCFYKEISLRERKTYCSIELKRNRYYHVFWREILK